MRLEDLDYELPAELIAQHPAPRRHDARMLVVERATGRVSDSRILDLPNWLRAGDALAINETRVLPARLIARRMPTGGQVELLFVRPEPEADGVGPSWRVLARPARHARIGTRLESRSGALLLEVSGEAEDGQRLVRVLEGDLSRALAVEGETPLPPYIHRAPSAEDRERYQTVYARVEGAVAAPTAGLHFTRALLDEVASLGVRTVPIVLHIGPGTFRPITGDPGHHRMDEEYFEVSADAASSLRRARCEGGRIVAVGTTVVRALESACDFHAGELGPAKGWTRKFILPPYEFRAVDALLTNFHLPRTTLLLLVAAFAGVERVRGAYLHAVERRYRFYSYGDAMLVT